MKVLFVIAALFALALGTLALDEGAGIPTWLGGRAELAQAQQQIAQLEAELAALKREATALEDDPFAIERAIREDLRFAKAGETVLRLSRSKRTNPRIP